MIWWGTLGFGRIWSYRVSAKREKTRDVEKVIDNPAAACWFVRFSKFF